MKWLSDVLAGHDSPEASDRLVRALRIWIKAGQHDLRATSGRRARRPSLARCAGLPESPERVRTMLRDGYLKDAADLAAPADVTAWARARALQYEVQLFMGTK